MKNILVAQSGGPTAAINATVAGVVTVALSSKNVGKIYGAKNGIQGVLDETFIDLREKIKNNEDLVLLSHTPAAALGSCRLKLKDLNKDKAQFEKIVEVLRKHEINCFVYIGGNDSMDTVDKLSQYCKNHNITDITVVGAPKTVDNDLVGTDHCPGFGSAAKYIGVTFAELERDCNVYKTKAVTIVEVMGRNAGWLTAAASLARVNGGKGPDYIYLCEPAFSTEKFIEDVKAKLDSQDSVLIAISEGIKNEKGQYVSEQVQSGAVDAFGHAYIAGSAKVLEDLVREKIGCKVRSIELNLMQRCAGHIASATDIEESKMLGMKACQCALEGENGVMASIKRISDAPYVVEYEAVPVSQVSNEEKTVPKDFMNKEGNDVTEKMMDYLKPLIQGEVSQNYKNGIPKQMILY
ncbi:6-phosphofructokinase [Aequitasia blattaphilus]|uniref:Pyrophosphate--fructose 6-phosphate 1-phosphotransferase n=1 Tax=Aequitasia blattaphilus TaxID=2949332 RepID=A0ABT1EEL3_9FIRM|nr:6-phosphofructokinase [Aequitasia blattaphilus]MCP1103281.1 6-phosphofructokinase [Aequitasia blattaphilus]MCR8615921.1 6-phosphofructokinase [Aequitasia blattaphilus]